MSLLVEVASLLRRPRNVPAEWAEEAYRAAESLAFGIDVAVRARGVKRTSFIEQRPNRVAFEEVLDLPGGRRPYELRLLTWEGVALPPDLAEEDLRAEIAAGRVATRFPHLLGHAGSPWFYVPREFDLPIWLPEPRPQIGPGDAPTSPARLLSLGSVARLRDELAQLDELLRERGYDAAEWLPGPLLEAADVSLETGLPIIISESEA